MLVGVSDGVAIAELHTVYELAEGIGAVELAPVSLGRLSELEDHV